MCYYKWKFKEVYIWIIVTITAQSYRFTKHFRLVLNHFRFESYFYCFRLLPFYVILKSPKLHSSFITNSVTHLRKSSVRLPTYVKCLSLLAIIPSHKNEITQSCNRTICEHSFLNHFLVTVMPIYIYWALCVHNYNTQIFEVEDKIMMIKPIITYHLFECFADLAVSEIKQFVIIKERFK